MRRPNLPPPYCRRRRRRTWRGLRLLSVRAGRERAYFTCSTCFTTAFTTAYVTSLYRVCFQFARSSCTQGLLRAGVEGTRVRGCGSRVRGCSCPRLRPTVPIYLYTMLSTAIKASKACVRLRPTVPVCMYVCMYVYIYTHTHVYTYIQCEPKPIYIYICIYIYVLYPCI